MNKKFLAKLLVLAMILAMVPATFLAASADSGSGSGSGSASGGYYTAPDTTVRVEEPVSEDGVIEANVVNGTAKVALNDKAVESLADLAEGNEIVLEIKSEGATKIDVSFSAEALAAVAAETGADLTIKSEVATITIPNEALSSELGTGTLRVSAQVYTYSVGFNIQASGKALKNIKGLQVTF